MLRIDSHNVNVYGQSSNEEKMLASFNASSFGTQEISISINSLNINLTEAEKEILYTDMQAFIEEAIEKISLMSE